MGAFKAKSEMRGCSHYLCSNKKPTNQPFPQHLKEPKKVRNTKQSIKQPLAQILSFPSPYLTLSDWFEYCIQPWGYNYPLTHLRQVL